MGQNITNVYAHIVLSFLSVLSINTFTSCSHTSREVTHTRVCFKNRLFRLEKVLKFGGSVPPSQALSKRASYREQDWLSTRTNGIIGRKMPTSRAIHVRVTCLRDSRGWKVKRPHQYWSRPLAAVRVERVQINVQLNSVCVKDVRNHPLDGDKPKTNKGGGEVGPAPRRVIA